LALACKIVSLPEIGINTRGGLKGPAAIRSKNRLAFPT
jgi:hypothetical protein